MAQNEGRAETVIIKDFRPAVEIMRAKMYFEESINWYQCVIQNLTDTALEENIDESHSEPGESYHIALDMLVQHFGDYYKGFDVCNDVLNYIIADIEIALPDLYHPKYKNRIEHYLNGYRLTIVILNEPRQSIFER